MYLVYFNISKEMLFGKDVVDFLGSLRTSTYKSIKSVEFLISEVKEIR